MTRVRYSGTSLHVGERRSADSRPVSCGRAAVRATPRPLSVTVECFFFSFRYAYFDRLS